MLLREIVCRSSTFGRKTWGKGVSTNGCPATLRGLGRYDCPDPKLDDWGVGEVLPSDNKEQNRERQPSRMPLSTNAKGRFIEENGSIRGDKSVWAIESVNNTMMSSPTLDSQADSDDIVHIRAGVYVNQ